jgi:TRAP-type C4-dicarboxylate transport system permease small subunit
MTMPIFHDGRASAKPLVEPLPMDGLASDINRIAQETDVAYPDAGMPAHDRIINGTVEAIGVAILVAIVGLIFLNASMRYLLGVTYIWGDELVIALVPWLTMCGMFLSVRRRDIIRIDFFVSRLSPSTRSYIKLVGDLVSVAAFGMLAIAAFKLVNLFGADRTIYLRLEKGWFMSAMVVGSVLVTLAFAVDALRTLRRR